MNKNRKRDETGGRQAIRPIARRLRLVPPTAAAAAAPPPCRHVTTTHRHSPMLRPNTLCNTHYRTYLSPILGGGRIPGPFTTFPADSPPPFSVGPLFYLFHPPSTRRRWEYLLSFDTCWYINAHSSLPALLLFIYLHVSATDRR